MMLKWLQRSILLAGLVLAAPFAAEAAAPASAVQAAVGDTLSGAARMPLPIERVRSALSAFYVKGRAAPYCARALPGADHGLQAPGRDGLQQVWAWLEQWAREPAAGWCAPLQRNGDSRVSMKPGDGGSRTPPV